jgi:predicted DNA-binding transcriptional regulator YafY
LQRPSPEIGHNMNRIDRLTAILIHLQSKKIVKAAEVADRFNISLRTVYRDVKALQEAGVPIGAEAGTGYYIVEGYHLPPVMFSKEEAAALLTGEKLMEQFSDQSNKKLFSNAMHKIRSVLRGTEKDFLESLEENIAVIRKYRPPYAEEFPNRFLSDIQQALAGQKLLHIDYFSLHKEEATKREVEPVGIFHASGNWHLIAWCRLRKDYRDFRVDRIKRTSIQTATFNKSKHMSLQEYIQKTESAHEKTQLIKLAFHPAKVKYFNEQKFYFGHVSEEVVDGKVVMSFLQGSVEHFGKWLLMWGNNVEIIYPEALKTHMKLLATEIKDHYL